MYSELSPNTQAILLLTAPLIAERYEPNADLLTPGDYKRLAMFLREIHRQPADLLSPDAEQLLVICNEVIARDRMRRLLDRGFLLSHAVERWQSRAIWVISRADSQYPKRFKSRLREDAPSVLYGCGDSAIIETGGLAVVGSRHVDEQLVDYADNVGRIAARANRTIISGGAKGIDHAAMHGALDAGGKVIGVLSECLHRAAINRENRSYLMDGQLILVSPYDPSAGFNVGHAMQRNKLIYALSDAALVVNADFEAGGTWAGAVEQLDKFQMVPLFVRANGKVSKGLDALHERGALRWPNPKTVDALNDLLSSSWEGVPKIHDEPRLFDQEVKRDEQVTLASVSEPCPPAKVDPELPASDVLFSQVREIARGIVAPMTDTEFASYLGIARAQAKEWLKRLVSEGVFTQFKKPLRYGRAKQPELKQTQLLR